MNRILLIG